VDGVEIPGVCRGVRLEKNMTTLIPDMITSNVWLERPELGAYAATVSQIWAMIESELSLTFIILSGSNLALGAAFSTVVPLRNRLEMIRALVDRFLEDPDRKKYRSLGDRAERLGKRRNSVVHGLWSTREDESDAVFLEKPYPKTLLEAEPVAYRKENFKKLILDLSSLRADLVEFRSHLLDLAKAQPFPRSFLLPVE
jgi:hypothetical protein